MKKKNSLYLLVLIQFVVLNALAETPAINSTPQLENDATEAVVGEPKLLAEPGEPVKAADPVEADKQTELTGQVENPAIVSLKPAVFVHKVKGKMNKIYKRLFTGLENNGYYVIFEPNIGRNLAHFSKRWGKDYNTNKLESIRSMVFCNGWYANKISNEDPNMLALCPLHVTLVHKKGYTKVLFVKPGIVSQGSAANSIALELEQDVIRIIKESAR